MALTFTCTISVAEADRTEVRDHVDRSYRLQYCMGIGRCSDVYFNRTGRKRPWQNYIEFCAQNETSGKGKRIYCDALPPVVSSVIETENLENIRKALLKLPESSLRIKVTAKI